MTIHDRSAWQGVLWVIVSLGVGLATIGLFVAAADMSERGEFLDGLYFLAGMSAMALGLGAAGLAWCLLRWPDGTRAVLGRATRWVLLPLAVLYVGGWLFSLVAW